MPRAKSQKALAEEAEKSGSFLIRRDIDGANYELVGPNAMEVFETFHKPKGFKIVENVNPYEAPDQEEGLHSPDDPEKQLNLEGTETDDE